MRTMTLLALAALGVPAVQDPPVKDDAWEFLRKGYDQLADGDAKGAIAAWRAGSTLDPGSMDGLVPALEEVAKLFGQLESAEQVRSIRLSSRVRQAYAVAHHATGACWYRFTLHRTKAETWVLSNVVFNTEPDAVLPDWLIADLARR